MDCFNKTQLLSAAEILSNIQFGHFGDTTAAVASLDNKEATHVGEKEVSSCANLPIRLLYK